MKSDFDRNPQRMTAVARKEQGFTLVELVAVTVLIALLAGLGASLGMKRYQAYGLEAAIRQVALLARHGHYLAAACQQPCKLMLDESRRQAWLCMEVADELTGRVEPVAVQDRYGKPVTLPAGVSFGSVQIMSFEQEMMVDSAGQTGAGGGEPAAPRMVTFMPRGSADGSIVTLTNGRQSYTLTITPSTSRVRIVKGTVEELQQTTLDLDVTE